MIHFVARRIVRMSAFAFALVTLLSLLLSRTVPVRAGGVVTTCDEASLRATLAGGGSVTFNCTGAPTISLSSQIVITAITSIDGSNGGSPVTLRSTASQSASATRIFSVTQGTGLALANIMLADGGTTGDGGCIFTNGAALLENVTMTNCRADTGSRGGALYIGGTGGATLFNSRVLSNSADVGGGIATVGALNLSSTYLAHNEARAGDGGGIWTISSTVIAGSTFYSNTANGYGGAIYNESALSTAGTLLNANRAANGGGGLANVNGIPNENGIFKASVGLATLSDVFLSDNSAGEGGGLYNIGTVTLTNAIFRGNSAFTSGGLHNTGTVSMTHAVFSNNSAQGAGGIGLVYGTLILSDITLSRNSSRTDGGGIAISGGTAILTNAVFSGNSATYYGGGIHNFQGTLVMTNAALSGNTAVNGGGGISVYGGTLNMANATLSGNSAVNGGGIDNSGTTSLANVTLSGNTATQFGGGINNYWQATLTNVTLSGNTAVQGGGIYHSSNATNAAITLTNSIVANSPIGGNCYRDPLTLSGSTIKSLGYNVSSDASCIPYFNQAIELHDLNNSQPNLSPLANNGGPTLTHVPFPPSPAIDAIPLGTNGCGLTLTTDQRGLSRPINGKCDIGSVEYETGEKSPWQWFPLIAR